MCVNFILNIIYFILFRTMFSMYKSQKNIQNRGTDYKVLYLEEKKLKQQFQRRAQIAELKYRKLAQSMNKKCVRCVNMEENKTKEEKIMQLKQFKNGLNLLNMGSMAQIPKNQRIGKSRVIQNFGVFGVPESLLIQPLDLDDLIEGQLLYASNIPSMVEQHAAKLAFPSGIIPKFYTGIQAKQKAIEIMSSSCSYAKTFVMSFQSKMDQGEIECEVKRLMNPQNRLYAFCLTIQDFSLVPNWNQSLIESDKALNVEKNDPTSLKALSCEQTDITFQNQKDCSIATGPRVYCIFSYYPFFNFYHQMLKAIVTSVKTERLVIYRQSGSSLAEADSRFYLQRVKQTYKQISSQIENWQVKLTKQFQLKLLSCQKISLTLNPESCMLNFLQDWGLSIFKMFNVESFIDVFTLVMLQQRIVFVSENITLLTLCVHLFSQLLLRPFKYPYPVINILPQDQGYFQAICPFIYGVLNSKKALMGNNTIQRFPQNVFIFLQKEGVQIVSSESKKNILKKRSKFLHDILSSKFKPTADRGRRVSNLEFTGQQINFRKDKLGICTEITKQINLYLNENLMKKLPKNYQVLQLTQKTKGSLKQNEDLNQMVFQKIKKQFESKSKDEFCKAMLDTQIVNTYLFK